jgi:TetR/AcrR family fatty acid metabolism transcriptional regulator
LISTGDKRSLRAERNRDKLLGAAMKVFSQKGYHRATLDEICKRAALGKGTVYQYFSNKRGLFLDVMDSLAIKLGDRVSEAVEGVADDNLRLKAAVATYMEFHAAHRNFYRLLIHEESSFAREIRERLRKRFYSYLGTLERVLSEGMRAGRMKKVDARSAVFVLLGMCNSLIFRWLMAEKRYPLTEEIPLVLEIFQQGILSRPKEGGK